MSIDRPTLSPPAAPRLQTEARASDPARVEALRALSVEFESVFLAQMLKQTGLGEATPGFDGGAGEDAFSGMLVEQQAKGMAARGGLGLAEHIFASLLRREGLSDE